MENKQNNTWFNRILLSRENVIRKRNPKSQIAVLSFISNFLMTQKNDLRVSDLYQEVGKKARKSHRDNRLPCERPRHQEGRQSSVVASE